MLPFTAEVLFALFGQYNAAIWPVQAAAYLLGIAALVLAVRPTAWSSRLVAAALALGWVWIGVVFHIAYFATINFSAPALGLVFVVEGLLLAWTGVIRGRVALRFVAGPAGWTGLALALFAMAGYPALGALAGHGWPQAAMFGVAPCPTAVFTLGLLLLTEGRTPLHLLAIPLLWALVAGVAAWFLGIPETLTLPFAGLLALGVALRKNRRRATVTSDVR